MKNTISDLNNYLFEQMERLNDDDLTGEDLETALRKAESIVRVSEAIIENNKVALSAVRYMTENGYEVPQGATFLLGAPDGK